MKTLTGTSLVGMSVSRDRVANDYYATPFEATEAILKRVPLYGNILEPACGEGHISKVLKEYYPDNEIVSTDLIERSDKFNCHTQGGIDFLTHDYGRKFNNIITNPPFKYAREFVERALNLSTGKVLIFAKIALLESENRRKLFDNSPLKTVYVFSKRVNPLRNGEPFDENRKPWASTMCFAWFEWEQGYKGQPVIKWI